MAETRGKHGAKSTTEGNETGVDRAGLELGIVAGASLLIAKGADAPLTRVIRALCRGSTDSGLQRANEILRLEGERLEKIVRAAKLRRSSPKPKKEAPATETVPNEAQQYKVDPETYSRQDIQGYG
ncbi:MAG: hypothetical protein LVQ95_04030 [Candidatus Micrarchaeales archaeon]|nr:hypothetical protein [Candidatus Micrarchaeales archaeon]